MRGQTNNTDLQEPTQSEPNSQKRERVTRRIHLSLFEKVIVVNVAMLIAEALAGLWVTSHNLETHHYLIDTGFIVLAALFILITNIALLHATFRPLFRLQATMRAVSMGQTETRSAVPGDPDIGELALTFNEMLDQLEQARREQAMSILQAQEEERRHVARELHDETSQRLTALLIHAEILSQRIITLPDASVPWEIRAQLEEECTTLAQLTQGTLDSIRVLAQQLRPSILDDLGLEAALRWLAEDSRKRFHIAVDFRIDMQAQAARQSHLPSDYETALFRIAQESLTNAARHARATRVTCSLCYNRHDILLSIQDDGCGFDPSSAKAGLGIRGMRERATLLGGNLSLHSSPHKGTTVLAALPLPITDIRESQSI
jgi:two-component system sensor histidine kinase UhpB